MLRHTNACEKYIIVSAPLLSRDLIIGIHKVLTVFRAVASSIIGGGG